MKTLNKIKRSLISFLILKTESRPNIITSNGFGTAERYLASSEELSIAMGGIA